MNHFYIGLSFLYFWRTALRRFRQCFFFNFPSSANHGGKNFYSAPLPPSHHHHKKASYGPGLTFCKKLYLVVIAVVIIESC